MSTAKPSILAPKESDIQQLLAAQSHVGTKNLNPAFKDYIWTRREDGIHLFNLAHTWEKLMLAARVLVTIENPADICVISARPYGQRATLKFSKYIGSTPIAGRYTPGTFTNYIQGTYREPRVILVADPRVDYQAIREASYVNIPTIAFTDSDSTNDYIDICIPCNNKAKHSLGLMFWLLAREILRLRGDIPRNQPWVVMPDLFFYRDPEDEKADEERKLAEEAAAAEREAAAADWGGARPAVGAPDPSGAIDPNSIVQVTPLVATDQWNEATGVAPPTSADWNPPTQGQAVQNWGDTPAPGQPGSGAQW